jgi:hypothetical protein
MHARSSSSEVGVGHGRFSDVQFARQKTRHRLSLASVRRRCHKFVDMVTALPVAGSLQANPPTVLERNRILAKPTVAHRKRRATFQLTWPFGLANLH